MQTISTALRNAINATSSQPVPRVTAEWNYNRFIEGISVTNAAGGRNPKVWPIESIIGLRNANSGISRAIVGQSKVFSKQSEKKFHAVSEGDIYKYWASPNVSDSATTMTGCDPTVNYNTTINVNKLVIRFDVEYARPDAVTTQVLSGGAWVTVGTATPDTLGKIVYYYNGSWGNVLDYNSSTTITALRVNVTSMDKVGVSCHIIELSARWERDLSADVESVSVSSVFEEQDTILPTGRVAANSCSISLANDTENYSPDNSASPYYGLLDENILFSVSFGYDTGAGVEYIQQGYFYSDSWGVSTDSLSATVECTDSSKILQETYVPESLFQKFYGDETEAPYRVMDVVRELLARVGFSYIEFRVADRRISIPYIWYKDEVTIWEALNDIAQAVPATFYFNEENVFVWRDADSLYANSTPVYTLDYDLDLIDLTHDFSVVANHVTVRYNKYALNHQNGIPITSELWAPEGDLVLRVAELKGSLSDTATHIPLTIDAIDFATWPESGIVRIGQERIRYGGKTQISDSTAPHYLPDIHPAFVDIERGILNTSATTHSAEIAGTLTTLRLGGTASRGMTNGYLRMANSYESVYDGRSFNMFGTLSTYERYYSTRVKFTDPCRHNIGGLTIHQSGTGAGYYLELTPTKFASQYNYGEVRMYKMDANGVITELVRTGAMRGVNAEVGMNIWYRLEIEVQSNQFACYVNGSLVGTFTDSTYTAGQFAPYMRGHSVMNIEYVMAGTSVDAARIELYQKGGTTSMDSTFTNHQIAGTTNYFEFGNLVHEAREFKVEYDVYPAIGASILNTNALESIIVDRILGPFRGSFVIENYSRTTAVLSGEDTINELGYTLSHALLLYGRAIIRTSEEVKEIKNEESIRLRGRQDVEVSTPWIEDEESATRVAKYITNRWASPVDVVTVNWVPNPAMQLGDLVSINFPSKGFQSSTHQYYVIGEELSWDNGLNSTLTLRRRR